MSDQGVADRATDDEELIMFLERDQLVADTSLPVPRRLLSRRMSVALWGLRVFVIALAAMAIVTFVANLH